MKRRRILLAPFFAARSAWASLPDRAPDLQEQLDAALTALGSPPDLAVSLIDLHAPARYAGSQDQRIFYAASLPKLGILLAAFAALRDRKLKRTAALDASLARMIRLSSNVDASRLIQTLGFAYIARTLAAYRLDSGLWVGKAYGPSGYRRHVEFWRPEPASGEWHAANTLQLARFFWLLDTNRLVDAPSCRAMKRILAEPGTSEYFVEGLRAMGVVRGLHRKFGAYGTLHGDAVLVEESGRRYVAAAMVNSVDGPALLSSLIQRLHAMVRVV